MSVPKSAAEIVTEAMDRIEKCQRVRQAVEFKPSSGSGPATIQVDGCEPVPIDLPQQDQPKLFGPGYSGPTVGEVRVTLRPISLEQIKAELIRRGWNPDETDRRHVLYWVCAAYEAGQQAVVEPHDATLALMQQSLAGYSQTCAELRQRNDRQADELRGLVAKAIERSGVITRLTDDLAGARAEISRLRSKAEPPPKPARPANIAARWEGGPETGMLRDDR
jgi:hypothetical protein